MSESPKKNLFWTRFYLPIHSPDSEFASQRPLGNVNKYLEGLLQNNFKAKKNIGNGSFRF